MGKSTGGTKLSSFPILLGASSFFLSKESTVQKGEGDKSPADLHSNQTCFCRCKWNFAWESNRDCKTPSNNCWSCSQTERGKPQAVVSGHMQLLGRHSTGMKGTWVFRCVWNTFDNCIRKSPGLQATEVSISKTAFHSHLGPMLWEMWDETDPWRNVRVVKGGLINDTEKCISNEASSPDSKLIPGIKE